MLTPPAKRRGVRWQRCKGTPCIDDTAFERRKKGLRPESAIRLATAVSRKGLPPHYTTLAREWIGDGLANRNPNKPHGTKNQQEGHG